MYKYMKYVGYVTVCLCEIQWRDGGIPKEIPASRIWATGIMANSWQTRWRETDILLRFITLQFAKNVLLLSNPIAAIHSNSYASDVIQIWRMSGAYRGRNSPSTLLTEKRVRHFGMSLSRIFRTNVLIRNVCVMEKNSWFRHSTQLLFTAYGVGFGNIRITLPFGRLFVCHTCEVSAYFWIHRVWHGCQISGSFILTHHPPTPPPITTTAINVVIHNGQ